MFSEMKSSAGISIWRRPVSAPAKLAAIASTAFAANSGNGVEITRSISPSIKAARVSGMSSLQTATTRCPACSSRKAAMTPSMPPPAT